MGQRHVTFLGITCQRDDGPYLPEWIAHHLTCGLDRMLVLSHDCADGSDALLGALSADPRITHLPFETRGKKSVQWQALKQAWDHPWVQEADWVLFFDCDEYFCAPQAPSFPDLVALLEAQSGAFDAVALPWRLFGSSGEREWNAGLTPERFTQAAPADLHFPFAHLYKTLARPEAFRQLGVHRPRAKPSKPARWLGPDGTRLPTAFASADGAISLYNAQNKAQKNAQNKPPLAWLNHYSLRSRQEFMVKRARGLPNHQDREIGVTYWAERNWNVEQNSDIAPMLPATREMLAQLLALPHVADRLEHCEAWHRRKYDDIMGTLEGQRLAFRLGFLTGSTPPTAEEGRAFLLAQYRVMQAEKTNE